jgi:hypothetical protein
MIMQERDFQLKKELAIMQAQLDSRSSSARKPARTSEHQQKMAMAQEQHHRPDAAGRVRHGGGQAGA